MAGHDEGGSLEIPDFPVNHELLEEATHTREEWQVVRDRLTKIEEGKAKVSPVVYDRVRKDYEKKLREIQAIIMEKKGAIDREIEALHATQKKVTARLDDHRHTLEEIKFRHTLGEFTEEEYQERSRTEQDKVSKLETILSAVASNLGRYESIFGNDEAAFRGLPISPLPIDKEEEKVGPAEQILARVGREDEEPETDDSGYIIEEKSADYFSDVESTDATLEISQTVKEKPGVKGTPATRQARVVVISGDHAGTTYPLKITTSFGRAESCTVSLRDAKVSRQHSQIQQKGNEFVLIDLNSSNGTFVNNQRIEEHVLANGDEIQIGDCTLQFQS